MRKRTEKTLQALRGNINTFCTLRGLASAMFVFSDFENSNFRDKVDSRHIPKSKDRLKLDSMLGSQDTSHNFCHFPILSTDEWILQNSGIGRDRRVQRICLLKYNLSSVRSVKLSKALSNRHKLSQGRRESIQTSVSERLSEPWSLKKSMAGPSSLWKDLQTDRPHSTIDSRKECSRTVP
jgi:hypothetical protein